MQSRNFERTDQLAVLKIVPEEVRDLLRDFYVLWCKVKQKRNFTLKRWKEEFGYVKLPLREGAEASFFQKDPIGYLIQASRSVRDFPEWLLKNLHVLLLKQDEPLSVKEFEEQVKKVYFEDAKKLPHTPKMIAVLRGLFTHDPFIRRKHLAKDLGMSENAVSCHIAEMKRRFYLHRLIEVDYYKLGLSRIYLFLKGFQDPDDPSYEHPMKAILYRYPLRAEIFPTSLAKQFVAYQIHTPPWNRRYDFLHECQRQVRSTGAEFLTGESDLFLATGRQIFYNLKAFDFKTGRWVINHRDLRFITKNRLMTGAFRVFQPYDIQYDVNRQKKKQDIIELTPLDLQICEKFWELEGDNNRFVTTHAVSKALGVPYRDVARRLEYLRVEQAVYFYYWSSLGLSSALTTVLITKDKFILNNFQSLFANLPVSSVTLLKSLRDKEIQGLLCYTYLPLEFNLNPLIQSTFFTEDGVHGFIAQTYPGTRVSRALNTFYDSKRKRWKWN